MLEFDFIGVGRCRKHWRHKKLNPSAMRVVSREFPHGGKPEQRDKGKKRCNVSVEHVPVVVHGSLVGIGWGQRGMMRISLAEIVQCSSCVVLPDTRDCPVLQLL